MGWKWLIISSTVFLSVFTFSASAQVKKLSGHIRDSHSEEPIPFASLEFKNTAIGALSDSAGNFSFTFYRWPSDTLMVTFVGFEDYALPIDTTLEEIQVIIEMERGKSNKEVIIKSKIGKGMIMWRKIVQHKQFNDRARFDNFSYELYNKLEADLNDAANNKLIKFPLLKPFKSVIYKYC